MIAALGARSELIDEIYSKHLTEICHVLDFTILLTFDYNDKHFTSFSSPLNGSKESVVKSVEKVKSFGCKDEKIIVGISSYAKIYKLKKLNKFGVGAQAEFAGDVEYFKVGFLKYY